MSYISLCNLFFIQTFSVLHRLEHFVKLRITGGTGHTHIQPLKEAKAIEVGAEIIGEAFIYSIAASFIVFEYWRSSAKEAALEADQDNEIDTLKIQMKNVEEIVSRIDDRLASIEKIKNITAKK